MCFWYAVAVQIPGPNVSFSPFPVEVPDFIWPFYRLCELDVLQLSNRQKFREGKHSGWQILMSWGEKKRLETKLVVRFDWRVFFNSQPPPPKGVLLDAWIAPKLNLIQKSDGNGWVSR